MFSFPSILTFRCPVQRVATDFDGLRNPRSPQFISSASTSLSSSLQMKENYVLRFFFPPSISIFSTALLISLNEDLLVERLIGRIGFFLSAEIPPPPCSCPILLIVMLFPSLKTSLNYGPVADPLRGVAASPLNPPMRHQIFFFLECSSLPSFLKMTTTFETRR